MKAPLLLGNDVRIISNKTMGVLTNKEAIAVSHDALGVQAQRVWTKGPDEQRLDPAGSAVAVAAPCDPSRPTQAWAWTDGVLVTADGQGAWWCLTDTKGTWKVGSWRGVPCGDANAEAGTVFERTVSAGADGAIALVTHSGGHLTLNNAAGASGPVPHSRYLVTRMYVF